ncbi:copper homeostasis protein CutC [Arthrobacter sp. MYb227]|uniref:copper homeostasis protein CutC n=1 Tax=Arthrobacter sp. MYb227 TaxID=1848601 RepID=UPI000CFBBCB3|nr:copper homeostasis protein CutC [Arthrobacter sp. MYb227]PQZ93009.1 copper homeostasis protein CutC [Arthrobacter sp. MYb227]
MPTPVLLEIAVTGSEGALVAVNAGADRLEICEALEIGGITSNPETIQATLEVAGSVGVHALIRPRGGNFVYSPAEIKLMVEQARRTAGQGIAGLVIGALDAQGDVDVPCMLELIAAAREANPDIELTFHRAIDASADPVAVVGQLIELDFTRVLSSGGATAAPDGVQTLAAMASAANGKIQIMAGGGMQPQTISAVLEAGVNAVHFSAKAQAPDGSYWITGAHNVSLLRSTLDKFLDSAGHNNI